MGATVRRVKTRPGQANLPPSPMDIVEGVFVGVQEASATGNGVPDIVQRNRRERAKRRLIDAIEARGPYPLREEQHAEIGSLVMRWAQKGYADAFPEADDLEVRWAEERAVLDAAAVGDEERRFLSAERAHRREVERRYGKIEIRGLQLSARVYQDLDIAYVPLHVEDRSEVEPRPAVKRKAAGKKAKKNGAAQVEAEAMMEMVRALDRPRVPATRALARHPRLLLVGRPGSGKSTLLAHLATRAAQGTLAPEVGWAADPVPFVVLVRSLHALPATVETLASAAGAEPWFLEAALRRGGALLLIDGLDEARAELAGGILPALTALLDAYPGTHLLATTRPVGAPGEDEPILAGFAGVRLLPMTVAEVHGFIERWCLAAELSVGKSRAQAEADAGHAADDLKRRVRLRGAIEKLAQTPLLCSVLCVVHRFLGESLPERRIALYDAMTNVLLYEWDRAKFPEGAVIGRLDAAAKRALLARVARAMHEGRVAEIPEQELVQRLGEHLPHLGRRAEEAPAIVAEIRDRSGMLVERTPGSFAFSHLTFQEYLAAQEMVKDRAYDLLLGHYEDEWWHEVLVLSAGFPSSNAGRLVRELLARDGEDVAEGTMLAAQCAETAVELPAPLRGEIEQRVAKLVPPKKMRDYDRLVRIGDVAGPVLLRELDKADTEGKATILFALGIMGYEPALGAMVRFLSDSATITRPLISAYGGTISPPYGLARCAMFATLDVAEHSRSALSVLLSVIHQAHPSVVGPLGVAASGKLPWREPARALLERYRATHAKPISSPAPKRGARSGSRPRKTSRAPARNTSSAPPAK